MASTPFSRTSDILFALAITTNKAALVPIPIVNHILFISSTLFYLLGYATWRVGALTKEDTTHSKLFLNNEMPQTYQGYYAYSAYLGVAACTLWLFSLTIPVLGILAAGLFLLSNVYWCVGENNIAKSFITLNMPRKKIKAQNNYKHYTFMALSISVLTLFSITLSCLMPPAAPIINIFYAIAITPVAMVAIYYYAKAFWLNRQAKKEAMQKKPIEVDSTTSVESPNSSTESMLHKMPPSTTPTAATTNTTRQTQQASSTARLSKKQVSTAPTTSATTAYAPS